MKEVLERGWAEEDYSMLVRPLVAILGIPGLGPFFKINGKAENSLKPGKVGGHA